MCVFRVWRVLSVICCVSTSVWANGIEYEVNYLDDYDNEITKEPQEGESQAHPECQGDNLTRWDKLFIALEDSHMRQNMLLESLEQCCGQMASLRTQVDRLAQGTCQQCVPTLESACRGQAEHASLRLQRGLEKLRADGEEREKRMNATFHQLLHGSHEQSARLKRLEEAASLKGEVTGTPRPVGTGAGVGSAVKLLPFGLNGREVTLPLDVAKMERALVAIATELQKVQVQLSGLTERGMTEEGQNGGRKRRETEERAKRRRVG